MARKYLTRCWYCSCTDLEPDERGIRCRSCGTTYNITHKPGSDTITEHRDYALAPKGIGNVKSSSPSSNITRQAAKARNNT